MEILASLPGSLNASLGNIGLGLILALLLAAFFAGVVDAMIGGGGLIQTPALLAAFPDTFPATLFGTNKMASVIGTQSALRAYARAVKIPWRIAVTSSIVAFPSAFVGAACVAYLNPQLVRPLVLVMLILVAIYTFINKRFGQVINHADAIRYPLLKSAVIGGVIGFYDGFFGPGTGSFLVFAFIVFIGLDFLLASACAKLVNMSTNIAALVYFIPTGHYLLGLGIVMAVANLAGSRLGSKLALQYGTVLIRKVFLVVVTGLILKLSYDLVRQYL